ncbi:NUDIX hydrolase [Streptomyces sp. R302]|uniref:NUDIX hydrolase n=1 Tax=unclassified Streptomyces TaxID=2593676 RepID=UPI00145F9C2C|nr:MULTISPECIES: NUDIX hydrolase [unclassified Streptomyces]NML49978.1 NUDIX hydrolase [Streptomyces sp. R301]NML78969.1 NUDIX hydrolase [Streptomyces sp. R302]
MDGEPVRRYERLRGERPELFRNEPGGIEVLVDPAAVAAAGGVVYADPYLLVVRDAVRFPDGRPGAYVRALAPVAAPGCVVLPLLDGGVVLIEHYRHATRSWHWEVPRGFGTAGLSAAENAAKEIGEEIGARVRELVPLGEVHPDTGLIGDRALLFAAYVDGVGRLAGGEGIRAARTVPFAEAEAMVADGRITDGFTLAVLTRARLAGLVGTA